jgi:hypothetical protein
MALNKKNSQLDHFGITKYNNMMTFTAKDFKEYYKKHKALAEVFGWGGFKVKVYGRVTAELINPGEGEKWKEVFFSDDQIDGPNNFHKCIIVEQCNFNWQKFKVKKGFDKLTFKVVSSN